MNEFEEWIEVTEHFEDVDWNLYRELDSRFSDTPGMYQQDPITEGLDEIIYE